MGRDKTSRAARSVSGRDPPAEPPAIGRLEVHGDRIMDAAAPALGLEEGLELVPPGRADDVQVEYVAGPAAAGREIARPAGQLLVVEAGDPPAGGVVASRGPELDAQDGRLELVEPRVHAGHGAHVALAPAVLAQLADALRRARRRR